MEQVRREYSIKSSVQNLKTGSQLTIVLANDARKEYISGKYIGYTESLLLIEGNFFTANKGIQQKIIGVPFGSMKYIEFRDLTEEFCNKGEKGE